MEQDFDAIKRSRLKRFLARYYLRFYVFWLYNFDRAKLKKNLLTRKEKNGPSCQDCGNCCKNCIAWNKNSKLCKLWNNQISLRCIDWPITPLQIKFDNAENICRYYWE